MDNRCIGVFDSGLGGLTTVKELRALLPGEDIVYFGDTSRVPYGSRSKDTIIKYAKQDIRFLLTHDVKMIIIACGTVSATITDDIIEDCGVPVIKVINPTAQAACAANRGGAIGVIGTAATVKSGAYGKAVRSIKQGARVIGRACPLFVPLVENGFVERDNPVTRLVAEGYLKDIKNEDIDTVILGCTHYPMLEGVISDILGDEITLIDSGRETARYAAQALKLGKLLSEKHEGGHTSFYVSDRQDDFSETAARFLGCGIKEDVKVIDIEQY